MSQFGLQAATRLHEVGIASNRGSACRGEYVPGDVYKRQQYAKRIVGRKQYGGHSSYMPIKVNMSGVLPIIFASTFLAIPGTIVGFVDPSAEGRCV